MRKNRIIFFIVIGLLILISIITLIVFVIKKPKKTIIEEKIDVEKLEMDFSELFDNQSNEYVSTLYNIHEEKSGEYKIDTAIPFVNNKIDSKVNKEINELFANKLVRIINNSETYNIVKIDYATSINENLLSLAIKCVLKEGNNAQRTIIKTYNYNLETGKEINIMDLMTKEKAEYIQNRINKKIENQVKKEETIINQGFNVYRRDAESDMYILENVTEFYVENDIIYIIYSYGNSSYTSEIDLIVSKI